MLHATRGIFKRTIPAGQQAMTVGLTRFDQLSLWGGGGNWDDAAIEAISQRLGFQLVVSPPVYSAVKRPFRDELGPLALVKQLRNRLAHGSISFAQCAEDVTVGRLVELRKMTVDYLHEVVGCFNTYVESFEYLLPERRPA